MTAEWARRAALGTGGLEVLGTPAVVVPGDLTGDELLLRFHDDGLFGVLVDDGGGRLGILPRGEFELAMSGRLGYGRSLFGRKPVAALANWAPLLVDATTTIEVAAELVLSRVTRGRYQDVVVRDGDGAVRYVSSHELLQALAGSYARRALHDELTGLPNRAHFLASLDAACATGDTRDLAVLFVDLDDFKAVNDGLGHGSGDRILREVAARLRSAARPEDLVARLAGDEFVVLVHTAPGSTAGAAAVAEAVASRLLTAVHAPIDLAHTVRPRASVGVAVGGEAADAETLLREADQAMYRAKQAGGNRTVVVTDVTDGLRSAARLTVDDTLPEALAAGQFRVHFQPIVALPGRTPVSVEALVRWEHPTRGLLPPAAFLPQAEASGFIAELSAWVLDAALAQLARWDDGPLHRLRLSMNVNLSRRQLAEPDLAQRVLRVLAAHAVEPDRLRLELPEGASREELVAASEQLRRLRQRGVRVSLDDVGTGASSLQHVSALPVDGLKIDRAFVAGVLESASDLAVVQLLLQLGHTLGLSVTAEGVETPEQEAALVAAGCRRGQGYFYARPLAAPAAEDWLRVAGERRDRGSYFV